MNPTDFSSLKLKPELLKNLSSLAYHAMTAIQAQSLPPILAEQDVIAQSKTGSGKTAAFALGILQSLDSQSRQVHALVLCPTRELAEQVAKEVRRLARALPNVKVLTLCGGTPIRAQLTSLEFGAHIIVGTPGRIEDHLKRRTLTLEELRTLVLDEADRMLDMGFQTAVDAVVDHTPKQRQTLLFSATFPDNIKALSQRDMRQPVTVKITETHDDSSIEQHFFKVDGHAQRFTALRLLLLQHQPESTLVFCNTKRETLELTQDLRDHGFSALALNGDLEQRERHQVMARFSNKSVSIVVATDVAARGLDIDSLDAVINYQLAHDPEVHVHRIGRTGRAGKQGLACSFYGKHDDLKIIVLKEYLQRSIQAERLPSQNVLNTPPQPPRMATLLISGGKKNKIRPGDILGALTAQQPNTPTLSGTQVGKIQLMDQRAYVGIHRDVAKIALKKLAEGKLKGRTCRARLLH